MRKYRKHILIFSLLFAGILALLFHFLKSKPNCKNCNVILISIDTLGSNHLPCYGYFRNTSPNLCKFAQENILFTNSFSNASWSLPSHFSIVTSLYPKHHGVEKMPEDSLDKKIITLPEILRSNNYETIYIGPGKDDALPVEKGVGRGFNQTIDIYKDGNNSYKSISNWKVGLEKLKNNNRQGKSTFLFLHSYWVHAPYLVNDADPTRAHRFTKSDLPGYPLTYPEYENFSQEFYQYFIAKLEKNISLGLKDYDDLLNRLKKTSDLALAKKITHENIPNGDDMFNYYGEFHFNEIKRLGLENYTRDLYDELIVGLDQQLDNLILSLIKDKQIAENTMIILTSHHGEEFGEHGVTGHYWDQIYNSVTSVPFIMYLPGYKNVKIDRPIQNVDLMPTMLDLLEIEKPQGLDGISLIDSIKNPWAVYPDRYLISQGYRVDSIRKNRWKLYVNYVGNTPGNSNVNRTYELFDLNLDPDEKNNLAEEYPARSAELFNSLNEIIY